MAGKPKGLPKSGGREAGTPNKSTADVKALIDQSGDIGSVIGALYQMAMSGDAHAAKILMEYRFGKPTQSVDFGQNSFVLTVNSQSDKTRQIIEGK